MGSVIGLNYQSVQFVMELSNKMDAEIFDKLRILESEALRLFKNGSRSKQTSNRS